MPVKNTITVVLLLFVAASVVYFVVNESIGSGTNAESGVNAAKPERGGSGQPGSAEPNGGLADKVIAYYFHGNKRCRTCRTIETYGHEALLGAFSKELEDGRLEWITVNFDEPANEHFIEDYLLTASSLVLEQIDGGQQSAWKELVLVWDLVGDKDSFMTYVREETSAYLEEDS